MVKKQSRSTRLFEELLVTPLAVPAAMALALIVDYGGFTASAPAGPLSLWATSFYAALHGVLGDRHHELRQPEKFEEGAASLGAGFWQRFFQVVIPNAMPGSWPDP